jgi:hypothetical protein
VFWGIQGKAGQQAKVTACCMTLFPAAAGMGFFSSQQQLVFPK